MEQRLQAAGARTSLYIPTNIAIECANKDDQSLTARSCLELEARMQWTWETGMFSDLSFDYRAIDAINRSKAAKHFIWNTWNINAEDVPSLSDKHFNLVIPRNIAPNPNIN